MGALLAACLVAGAATIASHGVGTPYWPDEHVYVQSALRLVSHGRLSFRDPREEIRPHTTFYVRRPDGAMAPIYPPGFPILLAAGSALGGIDGMRLVDPLAALLAVVLTFAVGRRLAGANDEALLAAGIVAVNPVVLRYAASFMSDVPGMLFTLGAVALAQSAARTSGGRALLIAGSAGVAVGAAAAVRPPGILAAIPALAVLALARPPTRRLTRMAALLATLATPPLAAGVVARVGGGNVPWELLGGGRLAQLADGKALALFDPGLAGENLLSLGRNLASPSSGGLLVPGAAGLVLCLARAREMGLVLGAWLLPTVALLATFEGGQEHVGNLRHFLAALPALAIAAATALGAAARHLPVPRRRAGALVVLATIFLGSSAWHSLAFLRGWSDRIPPTAGAVELATRLPAGSVVLGGRLQLQAIAMARQDLVLVAVNQLARDDAHPVVPRRGEKIGWRLNMTRLPWDWPVMVPANLPRLRQLMAHDGVAHVVVRRSELDACRRALEPHFAVTSPAARGEAALLRLTAAPELKPL